MRLLLAVLVSLCVLSIALGQNNRKKFGAAKASSDYEAPAEDYEGDALYYEDYDEGAKKDNKDAAGKDAAGKEDKPAVPSKEKPEKPSIATRTSAAKEEAKKDHADGGHPSLFAPRRNRTPFSPRPVNKPKPTLPSFIKKPVDPGSITTPKPASSRSPVFSATTAKTPAAAVIRATTARPSRFKNGGTETRRERTTSSPSTAGNSDSGNRRFGASVPSRNVNKPPRGNFRAAAGAAN